MKVSKFRQIKLHTLVFGGQTPNQRCGNVLTMANLRTIRISKHKISYIISPVGRSPAFPFRPLRSEGIRNFASCFATLWHILLILLLRGWRRPRGALEMLGMAWNRIEWNGRPAEPCWDCLMLLAKGPILISILINFGTFAATSSYFPSLLATKWKVKRKKGRQKHRRRSDIFPIEVYLCLFSFRVAPFANLFVCTSLWRSLQHWEKMRMNQEQCL